MRVNAVAPGLVATPWTADWGPMHEAVAAAAPLRRVATADDIAEACVSFAALYATGQVLLVDGGLGLHLVAALLLRLGLGVEQGLAHVLDGALEALAHGLADVGGDGGGAPELRLGLAPPLRVPSPTRAFIRSFESMAPRCTCTSEVLGPSTGRAAPRAGCS